MLKNKKITVVIPCYKVSKHIKDVINTIPSYIDEIIVIDDKCPENSGEIVQALSNKKVTVLFNKQNIGVGGSTKVGYLKAIDLGSNVCVKIDGDGQMNPDLMLKIITPIINEEADYIKGNRFNDFVALQQMPKLRLIGNSFLSFIVKLASGYWNIMDPTNGYCAISEGAIRLINFSKIDERYFFETDMLINLNLLNLKVKDVAIPAFYASEQSSLSVVKTAISFPLKIIKGLFKRLLLKYYVYNFNMASIYMLLAFPLLIFGVCFGLYKWFWGIATNTENTAGTIMLAALPVILGIQFLLQAINIDILSVPTEPKTFSHERK